MDGSTLPICVIRRVLVGQRKKEKVKEDWLQTNIFHTRVKHEGRAFNLIIDNGNGMNVVSQEIVQKLKLPMEKHPKPYKISWVDDTSIPVKHRCLVSFSLGQHYKDSQWCDIIPMKHVISYWDAHGCMIGECNMTGTQILILFYLVVGKLFYKP